MLIAFGDGWDWCNRNNEKKRVPMHHMQMQALGRGYTKEGKKKTGIHDNSIQ